MDVDGQARNLGQRHMLDRGIHTFDVPPTSWISLSSILNSWDVSIGRKRWLPPRPSRPIGQCYQIHLGVMRNCLQKSCCRCLLERYKSLWLRLVWELCVEINRETNDFSGGAERVISSMSFFKGSLGDSGRELSYRCGRSLRGTITSFVSILYRMKLLSQSPRLKCRLEPPKGCEPQRRSGIGVQKNMMGKPI